MFCWRAENARQQNIDSPHFALLSLHPMVDTVARCTKSPAPLLCFFCPLWMMLSHAAQNIDTLPITAVLQC